MGAFVKQYEWYLRTSLCMYDLEYAHVQVCVSVRTCLLTGDRN